MPIFPKLFKRQRTTSVVDNSGVGLSSSNFAQTPEKAYSLPVPIPDLRRGVSLPQLLVPQTGFPADFDLAALNKPNGNPSAGADHLQVPAASLKVLPPTPSSPEVSPARSESLDGMGGMWRGIKDRDANISKSEKMINKISDTAVGAMNAGSSSDGVIGLVKSVATNEEVRAIGKTILEGVPAIMSALEALTEIHPFLKAAYLPFKLIYHQETQRRENDQKRTTLFEKIKDVMLVLLELKSFGKNDTRPTPDGKPVLSRLAAICKDMKKDIEECYNVLNAQEKRSVGIKFLKASSWNKELGSYAARFKTRREDLTFALSMRSAVTMEEMNSNMKMMMDMFATMLSPQEKDIGRWINQNGGEKAVMSSDKKCLAMIKYQETISNGGMAAARADKGKASDDESKKSEKALAALRKEYREDISSVIQENLESYSKRFEMSLDDLGKDLGNKIQHQGDRLIKYLRGGPHSRIKDKMIYHIWKDQGWKGSAKTRPLVLAVRDYFVERVEHSKMPPVPKDLVQKQRPISAIPDEPDDNDDDQETDIHVPLPDDWMTAYLQVKRLRYLQQAFDPDSSGFTTISEINAFTHARPEDWSLPRWIGYWAIGWQIYATYYCLEIENLFAQIFLLRKKIGIVMPGNKRYVDSYIESTWEYVIALTSSIERYDSPAPWLEEKFIGYVKSQEQLLKERLEKIQYDIDAMETVSLVLRGDRIEQSIFPLLALLMRRHVAKMHLCLKQELDSNELYDDADTITWVIWAVWNRFLELKSSFQHQQVTDLKQTFEWLSCGLLKNYYDWDFWVQRKYFMDSDMTAWSSDDTIHDVSDIDLKDILAYRDGSKPDVPPEDPSDTTPPPASSVAAVDNPATEQGLPGASPASPVPTVEALTTDKISVMPSSPVAVIKPSTAELSITGTWYGWHCTDTEKPFLGMSKLDIVCGEKQADSETVSTAMVETAISGSGDSTGGLSWVLTGTMSSLDQPVGSLSVDFQRIYNDDGTWIHYSGTFLYDRDIIEGTFDRSDRNGSFMFKKVPTSAVLCSRPLVPNLTAKELWSFACNAVVDKLRRQKPGLSFLCERMTKMRKLVEFIYWDNLDHLDDAEQAAYSEVQKTFTFEETAELYKLYYWYDRAGDLQPQGYTCDNCGSNIQRSRVVCLDCISTDRPERTIDFCLKPECCAVASLPQRTDTAHLSSHLMLKTRDFFLLKDYFMFKQRAKSSLDYARDVYKDPTEDLSLTLPLPASPVSSQPTLTEAKVDEASTSAILPTAPSIAKQLSIQTPLSPPVLPPLDTSSAIRDSASVVDKAPDTASSGTTNLASIPNTPIETTDIGSFKCAYCHERVVTPAWYCLDCYDSWVCDSCEKIIDELAPWDFQKRYRAEVAPADDPSHHNVFHLLVRVARATALEAKPNGDPKAAELSSPLGQWEQIEKRIQELVSERFEAANSHVDKRLEEVETRLTNGLANIERLINRMSAQRA